MDTLIASLLHKQLGAVHIHERYVGNTQPDLAIPIGVIPIPIDRKTMEHLRSFDAISLTPHYGRTDSKSTVDSVGLVANTSYHECCSLLYSASSYNGISGYEKQYNDRLRGQNGGELLLKNEKGETVRTIIHLNKKDGEDVHL